MGTIYKIFFITLLVGSLVYSRSEKDNHRVEDKKVKSEHYWVKGDSNDDGDKSLKRKRTHKRRRKIRKPVKGLR